MTMVRLNAFGIATDGDDVASVAHDISTAWSSLHSALSGTAGMAGDDESAEQFAGVYDDQARSAATSAKNLVGMLAAFETLLAGTGSAYKDAELASAGQQGGSGIAVPASDYAVATDLPSSLGAGWPGGWGKVEDVLQDALRAIGVQLPQGDPDKLSSAASSWESYEASLRAASSKLSGGLTQVDAADIPQKATILAAKSTMSGHISTAADAATGAAGSLKQIKANYDQAAEEIRSMIEQLLAELALDVGISIALSFVTFGLGALAGAANGARIVVTWATRIAGVIRKLAFLNKIHAEQFLKAANMLRKLEHGSFVTRFTYETVKGTITGTAAPIIVNAVHGKGTSMDDIISNAVGSVVGGAFGFGSGAAMSRVGRNAAADAAGGAAPTFWRATAVEGAKGAASGAAGGAAGNVATDATAAALDPEHHHFNVLQSLANGTVFGTAGGGVTGAGGHALSSGWNAVTSSGRTHVPGAGGDGATTSTSSSSSVDSSVTLPDGGVSAESTGVGGDASGHAPTIDHGNTSTSAHAPTIDHGNSGASANAPTVADTGAPAPASPEGHVDVSNVQTPVVNDAAQAAPAQHAGGDRPHIDASQTPVVNDADPADHGSSTPVDTTSVPDPATSPASPDATVDAGSSHESATSTGHAPAADATQPAGAPAPDPATPQHGAADETPPSADIAATATHVQADRPTPTDSGTGQGAHAAAAADSAHVGAADAGTGHTVSDPARADANPVETVQTGTDNAVPTGTAHVPADASTAAAGAGAAAVAHTPVAPTTPGSQFRTDWEATNGRPWEPQYPPGSARPSQTVPLSPSTDQVLAQHGMTRADYDHLVSRPLDELSASELHTAVSIRDAAPGFQPGEAFQKVVNPGDVMGTFPAEFRHLAGDDLGDVFDGVQPNDPNFNRYGPVQVMGGFVARFDDVAHLGHDDLYGNLGLGYDGTMFSRSGSEPVFAVRAQLDQAGVSGLHVENDIATDLSNRFGVGSADGGAAWDAATPAERRDWMIDRGVQIKDGDRYLAAADPSNPYRGNGWAGEGTLAVPESTLRLWQLPDGAEMWRYNADGTQDVVAVMDNGHWVVLDTK